MNARNPLAAALLLIATQSMAQYAGAGGVTNLNPYTFGAPATPNFAQTGPATPLDDEFLFKCGTVPYRACTDVQLNRRSLILSNKACPTPVTPICSAWLMAQTSKPETEEERQRRARLGHPNIGVGLTEFQLMGTRPDMDWADPVNCNFIPCRTKTSPMGPPAPTEVEEITVVANRRSPAETQTPDMPAPFSPAEFAEQLRAARAGNDIPVVDLGNNRIGLVNEDGTVSVCGSDSCASRPASDFPNLADQIQLARAERTGYDGSAGGGMTTSSLKTTPQTPNRDSSGRTTGSNPSDEARDMGAAAADDERSLAGAPSGSGADTGSRTGSSGGGSYSTSAAPAAGNDGEEVVKARAESLDNISVTHKALEPTQAAIQNAASAFNTGKMSGFAAPNAPTPGTVGDPPVSPKHLGKIQATAND